ncbi:MAG: GatB/YqeY domain-containing protein [Dissulfurispiraceae bacterium]
MTFLERLDSELKEALKSRDELRLSVIRMLKASLKNKAIEKRAPLDDPDILSVLSACAKQRKESIHHFIAGQRFDLAEKEEKELEIITSYLPQQLSANELDALIVAAIKDSGAKSADEIGKVMKLVMPKTRGLTDGKLVNQRVRELLSA